MSKPIEELRRILKLGSYFPVITKIKGKDGFQIELGNEASLAFSQLVELGKLFGTDRIDVNSELERGGGCETCAYENANLTVQVYGATVNAPVGFDRGGYPLWSEHHESCDSLDPMIQGKPCNCKVRTT